jgi:hypothetical protein
LSTPSIRKLLKVLRRPLMLNDPSRGVNPPVPIADCRTPVVSSARVLAAVERKGAGLFARDDLPALTRIGLEARRRAGDFHGLGEVARREGQIHALTGPYGDRHVVRHGDREALKLGADFVPADPDGHELETAVRIGDPGRPNPRIQIGQRHRRTRDDASGIVLDGTDHRRRIELRVRSGRDQKNEHEEDERVEGACHVRQDTHLLRRGCDRFVKLR